MSMSPCALSLSPHVVALRSHEYLEGGHASVQRFLLLLKLHLLLARKSGVCFTTPDAHSGGDRSGSSFPQNLKNQLK